MGTTVGSSKEGTACFADAPILEAVFDFGEVRLTVVVDVLTELWEDALDAMREDRRGRLFMLDMTKVRIDPKLISRRLKLPSSSDCSVWEECAYVIK